MDFPLKFVARRCRLEWRRRKGRMGMTNQRQGELEKMKLGGNSSEWLEELDHTADTVIIVTALVL